MTQILTRVAIRYDVEMTRYAVQLKKEVEGSGFRFTHKPNETQFLMGRTVEINQWGLRDDKLRKKEKENYRIAAMGDSLTFGWGVHQEQTFVAHLQDQLKRSGGPVDFINFGHGNYNAVQSIQYLLERGQEFNPDHLVFFYFLNDAEEVQDQSKYEFLGHSRFITLVWSALRKLQPLFSPNRLSYKDYYKKLYSDGEKGWDDAQEAFSKLIKFSREKNMQLQVVLLPELHDLKNYAFSDEYKKVQNYFESQNIEVLNVVEFLKVPGKPSDYWVSLDDAHPNEEAHKKIAEIAFPFIQRRIK